MERVKLIWEFKGPNAHKTAMHHCTHLKEFAALENLEHTICSIEKKTEMQCNAFLVVERKWMNALRERLKPHRGQIYKE